MRYCRSISGAARLGALVVVLWCGLPAFAYERYAEETGKDCIACHVQPGGGKQLTAEGEAFKSAKNPLARRIVHFIAYYLHLVFAVMWFGTITYVHIILKPAYASKGLPRGELRLGWTSIVVMGVTGIMLTSMRFETMRELFASRHGLIVLVKTGLYLWLLFTAVVATFIVGPRLKRDAAKAAAPSTWFVCDGKAYDISGSALWKGGVHMVRHRAGEDLTEALKGAPHGADVFKRLPEIPMRDTAAYGQPPHVRGFFLMAYVNLFVVYAVLFLVALFGW